MNSDADKNTPVIEIRNLETRFGAHVVHSKLDLDVYREEIFAIVGGSGSGKSTLLREMILLHRPDGGTVQVFGIDLQSLDAAAARLLRRRWGVMFQHGGLFGSLDVSRNIGLPLREHTALSDATIDEIAAWKLELVGLEPDVGAKYPSELSGGMLKRASLARALALDPELLFLDEPTAGLDPASAGGFDELMKQLRDLLGLTIVMITHDLDLLWQTADRVAVLGGGRVQGVGSMPELARMDHPDIRQYFDGPRGRAAREQGDRTRPQHGTPRQKSALLQPRPSRSTKEAAWTQK